MKKKLPLAIRNLLEQLMKEKGRIFTSKFDNDSLFDLIDLDLESDFIFSLEKELINNSSKSIAYVINYKPSSEEHLNSLRVSVNFENLKKHLYQWYDLMEKMNQNSPIFDDPIITSYYDEIEPQFQIIDEDAEYAPYNIPQQVIITRFLDRALVFIDATDLAEEEKVDIEQSLQELKSTVSKSSKKDVVKKIQKIIAKGFKLGLEVGQKLLVEYTTELTKKLLTGT